MKTSVQQLFFPALVLGLVFTQPTISQKTTNLHELNILLNLIPERSITKSEFTIDTDPEFIKELYGLLYIDSLNYQKCLAQKKYETLDLYGNKIALIMIHEDSLNFIDRLVYIIKINSSSIIDSLSVELGPIQLFGSFGKKILSNFEAVEQLYYWDYDKTTELSLQFFNARQINKSLEVDSDIAVMVLKRKNKTYPTTENKKYK